MTNTTSAEFYEADNELTEKGQSPERLIEEKLRAMLPTGRAHIAKGELELLIPKLLVSSATGGEVPGASNEGIPWTSIEPFKVWIKGVSLANPGRTGYAAIVQNAEGFTKRIGGRERCGTNNEAELLAFIEAINSVPEGSSIRIHSNLEYIVKGFSHHRLNWKSNGWRNPSNEAPKNLELWQEIDRLAEKYSISAIYVPVHSRDHFIEQAHKLATSENSKAHPEDKE